jgi:hypothetical protein
MAGSIECPFIQIYEWSQCNIKWIEHVQMNTLSYGQLSKLVGGTTVEKLPYCPFIQICHRYYWHMIQCANGATGAHFF